MLLAITTLFKTCLPTPHRKSPPPPDIRTNLSNLPQELYDMIRTLTLASHMGREIIHITPTYLPPIQLQISRHHRRTFSAVYYGADTVLMLRNSAGGMMVFGKWIESLSEETLELLWEGYGTADPGVVERAVDVFLGISGGRVLRVWCEGRDLGGWVRVVRVVRVRVLSC